MFSEDITSKQTPVAKYERQTVTVTAADTDMVLVHGLRPKRAHDVRFQVIDGNAAGVFYRGHKESTTQYIVLKCSATGVYRVLLFLDSDPQNEEMLPIV